MGVITRLHIASRYLTHAVVLVAAILVPAFAVGGMKVHGSVPVVGTLAAERTASPTRGFLLKPEAVSATPRKREIAVYTVQDGDTVSGIAGRYGVTVDTIRWANNLKDIDTLKLDQKLRVPPVNGVMIKVQPGDTVESLAAKYAIDGGAIIDFNLVRDPAHLQPGGELMIPSGEGDPLPQQATDAGASGQRQLQRDAVTGVARAPVAAAAARTSPGATAPGTWPPSGMYPGTGTRIPGTPPRFPTDSRWAAHPRSAR